ncbi:hypothetical protein AHF37_01774 [Paragonimus kellicotti]|nr:hypothetical protein AHF37_01774 [Paragonimus kellicotti]
MAFAVLLINLVGTAIFTTTLCYYYGNWRKQHKVTTLIASVSWWLPALILTLLPVDIASAYFRSCSLSKQSVSDNFSVPLDNIPCRAPFFYAEHTVFLILWHIVYWSSQFLTWLLIPLMRSYTRAGDFTPLAKLRSALRDNIFYYSSYLLIFIVALMYLIMTQAVSFDLRYLKVLLITTSNTWGLFLVVIFLGYGLVEVPRSLWTAGNPVASLQRAYFQLSKRNMELMDEEERLTEIVLQVDRIQLLLPTNHPLQPYVQIVSKRAHLPPENPVPNPDSERRSGVRIDEPDDPMDLSTLSLSQLARVHRSLKSTQHRHNRARALYEEAVKHALWIEDVNAFRGKRRPVSAFLQDCHGTVLHTCASKWSSCLLLVQWYWRCYLRMWLLRVLAVVLSLFSLIMVWSECTFSVRTPTLSLVALLLKAEAKERDYFLLELSSFLTLGYLSFAVFYTVFRLRIFNFYRLVGSHHTDEHSLLFCGALLCRLTPSLCLNFLGLAHLDSHLSQTTLIVPRAVFKTLDALVDSMASANKVGQVFISSSNFSVESSYTQFMGHLDMIPFIANGFNIYFPILVLLLCLLTYFRFGSRVLHQLGVEQLIETPGYGTDRSGQSVNSLADDAIQDGRLLLRKERMTLFRNSRSYASDTDSDSEQKFPNLLQHYLRTKTQQSPDRIRLLQSKKETPSPTFRTMSMTVEDFDLISHQSSSVPVEYSEDDVQREFSLHTNLGLERYPHW